MQIHQVLLTVLGLAVSVGCTKASTPVAAGHVTPAASYTSLCRARPRCEVTRQRPVGGSAVAGVVVDIRIGHRPDAKDDVAQCDRREYWFVNGTRQVLLAADCEEQWGVDNPGPADTTMHGRLFRVAYLEHLSNDDCEVLSAEIDLTSARVIRKDRAIGNESGKDCVSKQPFPSPADGDGSADRPVLVIHR